jgi:hypothetical protein
MASIYRDVEAEWRDDGVDRVPQAGELRGRPATEAAGRPLPLAGGFELRRIFPLAIFLAGVLVGKAL